MSPSNVSAAQQPQRITVWDPLVRILHWLLVLAIALAWLSTIIFGWADVHDPAGYVALTAVVIRIVWGFVGSRYARFREFVQPAHRVKQYWRELLSHRERHYIGHNPLGGWMIVALLLVALLTGFTGWLFNTDMFWGFYWLSLLHEILAWTLLGLIVLHVGGVVFTSLRQRENLVRAMWTGCKQAPQHQQAQRPH